MTVVRLMIKLMVVIYSKTVKDLSSKEVLEAQKKLESKLTQKGGQSNEPGKIIQSLNKMADKMYNKTADGDVDMN